MKGVIITEFIDMVEEKFGLEVVDDLITSSDLKTGGVYTSVGTYDHTDFLKLVNKLSQKINVGVPDLLIDYGKELFKVFVKKYNFLFKGYHCTLDFLEGVNLHIHVEVSKLYPDAKFPKLIFNRVSKDSMVLMYESERKLSNFGIGLIYGCAEYFNEEVSIDAHDKSGGKGDKVEIKINVKR